MADMLKHCKISQYSTSNKLSFYFDIWWQPCWCMRPLQSNLSKVSTQESLKKICEKLECEGICSGMGMPTHPLGVRIPLRSRHFLSQKLWYFHKNTRWCVENECCCPCTVNISNVYFTSKISIPPWPVFSKCLALIVQMVKAFSMNPKVGVRVPLRSRHFLSQKLLTLSQEHPFVCRKWMLLPTHI